MVYEEKVLTDYDIAPLQAVGWEGTFRRGLISQNKKIDYFLSKLFALKLSI